MGRGVQSLFGQCPNKPGDNFRGASLSLTFPENSTLSILPTYFGGDGLPLLCRSDHSKYQPIEKILFYRGAEPSHIGSGEDRVIGLPGHITPHPGYCQQPLKKLLHKFQENNHSDHFEKEENAGDDNTAPSNLSYQEICGIGPHLPFCRLAWARIRSEQKSVRDFTDRRKSSLLYMFRIHIKLLYT